MNNGRCSIGGLERKLAKNIKKNPCAFYAHLNKQTKLQGSVGPLQDSTGATKSDNKDMAELLNMFFTSVFTKEDLPSCSRTDVPR